MQPRIKGHLSPETLCPNRINGYPDAIMENVERLCHMGPVGRNCIGCKEICKHSIAEDRASFLKPSDFGLLRI